MPVLWPLLLLSLATIVLELTDLDTAVCRLFFGGGGDWPMLHAQPFHFFYQYGSWPGYAIGFAGLLVWLVGLTFDHDLARRGFFCMMLVLLGPGLLVNVVLKTQVSRPRPCQMIEFGGKATFQQVFEVPDKTSQQTKLICKSFPSGHASIGFATLAIPFLLRRKRKLFVVSLGIAISWGLLIGISRVIQGRHFPSDVLWSAAIIYLLAVTLYYVSGLHRVSPFTATIKRVETLLSKTANPDAPKTIKPWLDEGHPWNNELGQVNERNRVRSRPAKIAA